MMEKKEINFLILMITFIDHNMTLLQNMNMSNNNNFANLIKHNRIFAKPQLTSNIITSIQSLQQILQENNSKLIYVTSSENIIIKNIEKYMLKILII